MFWLLKDFKRSWSKGNRYTNFVKSGPTVPIDDQNAMPMIIVNGDAVRIFPKMRNSTTLKSSKNKALGHLLCPGPVISGM